MIERITNLVLFLVSSLDWRQGWGSNCFIGMAASFSTVAPKIEVIQMSDYELGYFESARNTLSAFIQMDGDTRAFIKWLRNEVKSAKTLLDEVIE